MGEPGGLPSMGSHRVGHDRSNLAAAVAVRLDRIWISVSAQEAILIFSFDSFITYLKFKFVLDQIYSLGFFFLKFEFILQWVKNINIG